MMGRLFKRLRLAGQDVPRCDSQTIEFLSTGMNLIKYPVSFPVELAEAAWKAHKEHVVANWVAEFEAGVEVPICFGARCFDKTRQVGKRGLDERTKNLIDYIEHNVEGYLWRHE